MIDQVVVFSTTGVVLWTRTFSATRGDPINSLIRDVLLQERGGRDEFMYDAYRVRWVSDNKRGIYYVAVCQSFVPVDGTDRVLQLLEQVRTPRVPCHTNRRVSGVVGSVCSLTRDMPLPCPSGVWQAIP